MNEVRTTVMNILDRLPPTATLEDVIYHLYVRSRINKGLADIEAGRVIDHEEVERRIARWLHEADDTPKQD